MRKRFGRHALMLFLLGTFSMTQIRLIGSIGVSEVYAFIAAPFFIFRDYYKMRKYGLLPVFWLSILVIINCIGSIISNDVWFENAVRGLATTYAMFALLVVMHHYLSEDLGSYKWLLLGNALSMIINIFVMQTGTDLYLGGADGTERVESGVIVSGALFWLTRIKPWLALPTAGWYLKTPLLYSICTIPILGVVNMLTSDSGRSALLVILFSAVLITLGGKSVRGIKRISKYFWLVFLVLGLTGYGLKKSYQFMAERGYLNEKAQAKYENQTKRGSGTLQMLMSGRMEFFCGLFANLESPIWGYGPWAIDWDGIYERYLIKFGSSEDITKYFDDRQRYGEVIRRIPQHSMIIGGWTWYGISAFFFWLYVLYLIYDVLKNHMWVAPPLFGYFALTLPGAVWSIFFSPFGQRMHYMAMIVLLVLVRAARRGKFPLQIDGNGEIINGTRPSYINRNR